MSQQSTPTGHTLMRRFDLLFFIGLTAVTAFALGLAVATPEPGTVTIPTCATEDSDNCIWDAQRSGNGAGKSFISLDGVLYVRDVQVNP